MCCSSATYYVMNRNPFPKPYSALNPNPNHNPNSNPRTHPNPNPIFNSDVWAAAKRPNCVRPYGEVVMKILELGKLHTSKIFAIFHFFRIVI